MSLKTFQAENTKGLVIDRPGYVVAIPVLANGVLDYDNAIRSTAGINTVTVTNTRTKTDIPDGNSFYPIGSRVTALSGSLSIEFSTYDTMFEAMASGTGKPVETQNDKLLILYDAMTVTDAGTIEIDNEKATDGIVKVVGVDGTEFEEETGGSAPSAAGKYKVSSASGKTTFTFHNSDKGKAVVISMDIKINTISYSYGKKPMPAYQFIIQTTASNAAETMTMPLNVIVSRASISSDSTIALQKDPSTAKTLTFDIYAPRAGEQPVNLKIANVGE